MISIVIETDSPDNNYDDNATEIELIEAAKLGVFESHSQLLVSDIIDDDYPVDNVVDDSIGDRTHKIALGGKVKVAYSYLMAYQATAEACVPKPDFLRKVTVNLVILRDKPQSIGGMPVIGKAEVISFWQIARERYAQVGVVVEWNPPVVVDPPAPGVDLSDGLLVRPTTYGSTVLADEAKLLIDIHGTRGNTEDIHVFYVNEIWIGLNEVGGSAVADYYYDESEDDYTYNVFLTEIDSSPWQGYVAAHELGHLLTDAGHPTLTDTWRLMVGGELRVNDELGSRRFVKTEEDSIRRNSHVKLIHPLIFKQSYIPS